MCHAPIVECVGASSGLRNTWRFRLAPAKIQSTCTCATTRTHLCPRAEVQVNYFTGEAITFRTHDRHKNLYLCSNIFTKKAKSWLVWFPVIAPAPAASSPRDLPHTGATWGIPRQVESGEPFTADRNLTMDKTAAAKRGCLRGAPEWENRQTSILPGVSRAAPQARVHLGGGSALTLMDHLPLPPRRANAKHTTRATIDKR